MYKAYITTLKNENTNIKDKIDKLTNENKQKTNEIAESSNTIK